MAVLTYARYIAIILFHTKELKLNNIISLMIRLILNAANTYHNFLKLFSYVVGYALPLQVCLLLMNIPLGDPITKKFVKSNTLDRQSHAHTRIYIYICALILVKIYNENEFSQKGLTQFEQCIHHLNCSPHQASMHASTYASSLISFMHPLRVTTNNLHRHIWDHQLRKGRVLLTLLTPQNLKLLTIN